MHEIFFYCDKNGKEPVAEYMDELSKKKGELPHTVKVCGFC